MGRRQNDPDLLLGAGQAGKPREQSVIKNIPGRDSNPVNYSSNANSLFQIALTNEAVQAPETTASLSMPF
jgi:hypothetical protein